MENNIYNMTNYELGVIAKAFMECETHKWCNECPCDGIICGIANIVSARNNFNQEIAKRLMEEQ